METAGQDRGDPDRRHRQRGKRQASTAPTVDSVNAFEEPEAVAPKPITAKVQGGTSSLIFAPNSVSVISVGP